MNIIKNKGGIILLVITFIAVTFVTISFLYRPKADFTEETNEETAVQEEIKKTVFYTEGDEDKDYNYIINARDIYVRYPDLPYRFYLLVGDTLSDYLKELGYTGRQLEFTNIRTQGYLIKADIKISDSDDILQMSYEYPLEEFNLLIKKSN